MQPNEINAALTAPDIEFERGDYEMFVINPVWAALKTMMNAYLARFYTMLKEPTTPQEHVRGLQYGIKVLEAFLNAETQLFANLVADTHVRNANQDEDLEDFSDVKSE